MVVVFTARRGAAPEITKNVIADNSADSSGGGIYCSGSSPEITNNLIYNNYAGSGGALRCYNQSSPILFNDTIIANSADFYGGGVYCYRDSQAMIVSCILWDNSAAEGPELALRYHWDGASRAVVIFSGVAGGKDAVSVGIDCTLNWGLENVNTDPVFLDADNEDFRLLKGSPCIDMGDPDFIPEPGETDLDGKPRVAGGRVDMGAYETSAIDLDPMELIVPAEANAGDTAEVAWRIANSGKDSTLWIFWSDVVYLSLDDQLDATDIEVKSVDSDDVLPLGSGADYSRNINVPIPLDIDPIGMWYMIMNTDDTGAVRESSELNNVLVQPLRILIREDVNRDDQVNVADLLNVRSFLGDTGSTVDRKDVNVDGIVNVADLLMVRNNLGAGM